MDYASCIIFFIWKCVPALNRNLSETEKCLGCLVLPY